MGIERKARLQEMVCHRLKMRLEIGFRGDEGQVKMCLPASLLCFIYKGINLVCDVCSINYQTTRSSYNCFGGLGYKF